MAVTINADTSNGLVMTPDTSGEIKLQSAGTDIATVNSSGVSATTFIPTSSTVPTNGVYLPTTNTVGLATNSTERMRIASGGELLIGQTADPFPGVGNTVVGVGISPAGRFAFSANNLVSGYFNRNTGNGQIVRFSRDGNPVGSIDVTLTTTAYLTSSDYRLKENIAPMSGSIDRLKQLNPSTWSWKPDGSHGEGFLAHEAQTVVPESVTGTKDAVDDEGNPIYQGIDQAKLVPLLTAALQEAITKIEDLETRIQALEGN